MRWIGWRLEKATWLGFVFWFVVLFAFSTWAFNMESPWTRALAAGGGVLPESQPGFPPGEPAASLAKLGAARGDYVFWQALDIPFAIMNLLATSIAMALALKKTRLEATLLRFLLLLPVTYVACELVENTLVALFALGLAPTRGGLVLVQQVATTMKFAAGYSSLAFGLLGVFVAAGADAVALVRRARRP
ncbi:MAG: hypothetical protein WD076_07045 [Parvularculaceae bacterium]